MTRKCEKWNEKKLPYVSCKKIGYFLTLGGRGVSENLEFFNLSFWNPSLKVTMLLQYSICNKAFYVSWAGTNESAFCTCSSVSIWIIKHWTHVMDMKYNQGSNRPYLFAWDCLDGSNKSNGFQALCSIWFKFSHHTNEKWMNGSWVLFEIDWHSIYTLVMISRCSVMMPLNFSSLLKLSQACSNCLEKEYLHEIGAIMPLLYMSRN